MCKIFLIILSAFLLFSSATIAQSFVSPSHVSAGYYWDGASKDTFSVSSSSWGKTDSLQLWYNADSTMNARVYYMNDPDSGWIVNLGDAFLYDEMQRDTSHVYTQWDPYNQFWINVSKEKKSYDASNNLLTILISNWDTSGVWINSSFILNMYNTNNNLIKKTYMSWNTLSSQWDSTQKFVFTYNASNQRTLETDYSWDGTTWQNVNKYSYAYNSLGLDTLMKAQYWTGTAWKNNYRDSLEYESNNHLIRLTRLVWDQSSASFSLTDAKSEYTFNGNNQLTQRNDYNGDGGSTFNPSLEYDYTYDTNGNNDILILKLYNQGLSVFENYDRYNYYYTVIITDVKNYSVSSSSLLLFPNPAKDELHIQTIQPSNAHGMMQVLDATGKITSEKSISLSSGKNLLSLDIADFSAGIYFIRVVNSDNHSQSVSRFIKH